VLFRLFYVLGIPSDAGGGICRGAAHGPLALREVLYARHPDWAVRDLGDITVVPQLSSDALLSPAQKARSGRAVWGAAYKPSCPVSPLDLLRETLIEGFALRPDFRPFVLGGDHSVSGAIFQALHKAGRTRKLAVLHLDAHTDLLEERFGVEHCFATWAAHAVKTLGKPSAFVQVGVRVSRRPKSYWEKRYGLRQLRAPEVLRQDPTVLAAQLLAGWKKLGCEELYVSFDVDALDPRFVPSTGTPEPGGLDPAWARSLVKLCSQGLPLVGADVVEMAPVLGSKADAARSLRASMKVIEGLQWPR